MNREYDGMEGFEEASLILQQQAWEAVVVLGEELIAIADAQDPKSPLMMHSEYTLDPCVYSIGLFPTACYPCAVKLDPVDSILVV